MNPGLNSNVSRNGIEYHVQTEDLGRQNPHVLTLVFRAGAIISREKVNYRDALGEGASEAQIKSLMDRQHQRVIRSLMVGEPGEPSAPPPSFESPLDAPLALPKLPLPPADKTLDELIAEYIRSRNPRKPR
jgi:hypothetical protein